VANRTSHRKTKKLMEKFVMQYIIHAYAIHYVICYPSEAVKYVEVVLYPMFSDIRAGASGREQA
jgi:hypothetical protein